MIHRTMERMPARHRAGGVRGIGVLLALLSLGLTIASPARAGMRPRYGGTVAAALPQPEAGLDPAQASTVAELFVAGLLHQPPLRRGADGTLAPVLLAEPPSLRTTVSVVVIRVPVRRQTVTRVNVRKSAVMAAPPQ